MCFLFYRKLLFLYLFIKKYIQNTVKMVKITDKNGEFLVYFPKHLKSDSNSHTLVLKDKSTLECYEFLFEDTGKYADFYLFNYNGQFKDLVDGEYEYNIDNCKAIGLIAIGKYYTEQNSTVETIITNENDDDKYIYYED